MIQTFTISNKHWFIILVLLYGPTAALTIKGAGKTSEVGFVKGFFSKNVKNFGSWDLKE